MTMLNGEKEAIEFVKQIGAIYGYGNLIKHLRDAWSERLQNGGAPEQTADFGAGHICVWCRTDNRTGKKVKIK